MRVLALVPLFLAAALAADVGGKWRAEFTTPDGAVRTNTFEFKMQDGKLTGAVAGQTGNPAPIADAKLSGDDLSFHALRNIGGNDIKVVYNGKVVGNEIRFKVQFGDREFEMTAKRVSE